MSLAHNHVTTNLFILSYRRVTVIKSKSIGHFSFEGSNIMTF